MAENTTEVKVNQAVLVGLNSPALDREETATERSMEELAALLETAGGVCVGTVLQNKDTPDPRTFIGEGKVAEVRELATAQGADMVIFDNALSPSQQRVLSEELGVSVMDRSALILDIFAQRARTKEGRLQVELAQYKYLLPRLTGMWGHLVRQTASGGKSPIGTRGPGETQLETDRRHIRKKIAKLEEDLEQVRRVRGVQRERRIKNEVPVVAIVGYTNAGKSTLLNRLTGAGVLEENKLFATLDPTTRTLTLDNGTKILLTDTVGFIRKLPHHLVEAFKSTLEEAKYADVILHVVDASNEQMETQMYVVYDTLRRLEVGDKPILTLFNKTDREGIRTDLRDLKADQTLKISAKTGAGLSELTDALEEVLRRDKIYVERLYPFDQAGIIQLIRKEGELVSEEYTAEGIEVRAYVPRKIYEKV